MNPRYKNSLAWLEKAEQLIPTGSQTFSKSIYSLPKGAAPLFIEKGEGAYVWDLDGHRYIDLVNGLLSVSLGYRDPDVDRAIAQQLQSGISFSLPHRLEYQLAEHLVDMIPCAEQVRFGKNGSDATSAAIRLARAVTGREHIAFCGYHGWHDWYIGATARHLGVPEGVRSLSHSFSYNDMASLLQVADKVDLAAIIMEPMSAEYPAPDFLPSLRRWCDQQGVLLIFDETITGFRFHEGGAQSLFDVTPDLATFGKGMGNGMPISAITGRRELMEWMDRIFFSGTFGGETLSLAACCAVIEKMQFKPVLCHIHTLGERLATAVNQLAQCHGFDWFTLVGHPAWKIMQIQSGDSQRDLLYKTFIIEQLAAQGVLLIGSHNISYALSDADIEHIIQAYGHAFGALVEAIGIGCVEDKLSGELLKPVFQVRK